MTKPLPTLTDIAAEAGVSLATASRVLSGSRDRVSAPLVERVQAAARALHYVPNAHAQALARASSTTIGLIVHDVSDPYFAEIARGVLQAASTRDHLVLICNTFRDPDRELEYVGALRAQRVHSILLAGSGYTDPAAEGRLADELAAFRAAGGRVASVGRHAIGIDAILPDNVRGAGRAARHLADLGHRRIGVLAGPVTLTTMEDRIAGFRAGLADAGLTLDPDLVVHGDFTRAGGYQTAIDLLDARRGKVASGSGRGKVASGSGRGKVASGSGRGKDVTAVFALNDAMAVGALAAYRDRGVDVPGQLSVIGFDDIPLAADVTPALTTIRLPMEDLGTRAVELALREDPDAAPTSVTTDSELIVRGTTSSPRSA